MIDAVAMDEQMWRAARRQVGSDVEQASFFLARLRDSALECHAMRVVEAEAFERQSATHIALTGQFATDLIRWAAGDGSCLVELHSHGGRGEVCMSASDMSGLDEWVPHVRWRLGGLPYAAIVQGQTTIDGLVWAEGTEPAALRKIDVIGRKPVAATGLSHERWYA